MKYYQNLRAAIEEAGMTHEEVVKVMGISRSAFHARLVGERDFKLQEVFNFCSAIENKKPIEELFKK